MKLKDRRDLHNGFGDSMSRAIEMTLTPAIFGFLGWLLDRVVGTVPLFTVALVVLCLTGMFAKMWYVYDAQMKEHEAEGRWAPGARGSKQVEAG